MTDRRKIVVPSTAERRQNNRRAFPRWPGAFQVRYGTGKQLLQTVGLELGEGGLSFRSEKSYPLESELNVQFRMGSTDDDDAWIAVKAIVRHSDGDKLGVEFLNLMRADRLRIVDFMSATK